MVFGSYFSAFGLNITKYLIYKSQYLVQMSENKNQKQKQSSGCVL